MSVPGWNPDWYHAGESIYSVALKLAYGNSTTVREARLEVMVVLLWRALLARQDSFFILKLKK